TRKFTDAAVYCLGAIAYQLQDGWLSYKSLVDSTLSQISSPDHVAAIQSWSDVLNTPNQRISIEMVQRQVLSAELKGWYTAAASAPPSPESPNANAIHVNQANLKRAWEASQRSTKEAFQSDTIPAEILQTLLNLAEFMEHDVEALPIDIRELGELAQKCHAYAKALHYKELEFHTSPSTCIEALISINNQVGQPEAAVGILKYAQLHHKSVIHVKESWFEKLQDWDNALDLYNVKLQETPNDMDACTGKMRCLEALGEWDQLAELARQVWDTVDPVTRGLKDESLVKAVALLGARACCESYLRAYHTMITLQQLSELEEIVAYKKMCISKPEDAPLLKRHMVAMWSNRLAGCKRVVDVWQHVLAVRSLVLSPHEDVATWLQFASLCRQSNHLALSLKVGFASLGYSQHDPYRIAFAYLKHLWAVGDKSKALNELGSLVQSLSARRPGTSTHAHDLVKCQLKWAEWQMAIHDQQLDKVSIPAVLSALKTSTELDPTSYKGTHELVLD
ncbi:hypothetical protein DYB25_008229, partial [Aphanomyces astaci]